MINRLLFFAIVFLGLSLRLYGLNWDRGHHLHPDERFLTMTASAEHLPVSWDDYFSPTTSPLNPRNVGFDFFVYGTLPLTLTKVLATVFSLDSYDDLTLLGRFLSAVFDALTILIVYQITLFWEKKYRFDQSVKFLASFFYAIAVLPIQLAHFFTVDVLFDKPNSGEGTQNYYKLKNAQYRRGAAVYSPFPANPEFYDADDSGGFYFLTGEPGTMTSPFNSAVVTLGTGITNSTFDLGALTDLSYKKWKAENYPLSFNFTPAHFLEYAQSRKDLQKISSLSNLQSGQIYLYENNSLPLLTLNDQETGNVGNKSLILIVKGSSVRLDELGGSAKFNPAKKPLIIIVVNASLQFAPELSEANGVFIADSVDLGTTTDKPLKIRGNLIAKTPIDISSSTPLTRQRSDNQRPSLFVLFDPTPYISLLNLLATSSYQWSELIP